MKVFVLLLSVFLLLSSAFSSTVEIHQDLLRSYQEFEVLFGFSPEYELTLLHGTGQEHARVRDFNGSYEITLYTRDYSEYIARHEMAHVFHLEYIYKLGYSPDQIPIWYHELVAVKAEQPDRSPIIMPSFRLGVFNFTGYTSTYPSSERLSAFYRAIRSFATFLGARVTLEDLAMHITSEYLETGDMESAFKSVTGRNLGGWIARWRFVNFLPVIGYLLLVLLLVYFLTVRRERRWQEFVLDQDLIDQMKK